VEITRLSPDDEAGCAAAVALLTAAWKVDCPELTVSTPKGFANGLRYGWDLVPNQAYLGRDTEGNVLGVLMLDLPKYENTNQLWIDFAVVHPDYRERGFEAELLGYAEEVARENDRDMMGLGTLDLPREEAIALENGYERKAVEVNRRQDLTGLDWSVVQRLYDEAVAASTGYELLRINGPVPEEMVDGMIAVTESINDAPTDDLDTEDNVYSRERLRGYEEAQDKSGNTLYRVVAREKATGAPAGHTIVAVEQERPHIAWQHDTAVSRDHRGHRLGALLKCDLLLWLREAAPAVTQIDTWNAESNNHMIGINEQLDYRVIARFYDYQKKL
jgi:GNAT superfamily N-acetyltransferase